ncbi:MAG: magnesium transporter CorA family protein [Deltaproteobacteria bacterium]|jgi:magnesium transporter|nr:magnesium transporter CorA family protein [Deltaproteobacteria bacterium]
MLTRLRCCDEAPGFVVCRADEPADWLDLETPDQEELAALTAELGLPPSFLADPLDPRERPRLDVENEAAMVIIRAPYLAQAPDGPAFATVPLGLVVVDRVVLTVCSRPGLVREIMGRWSRKPRPSSHFKMLIKILIESSADFMRHLELMEDVTDLAENSLAKAQHNEQIMTLLSIDKALINYTVALKSNRDIMSKLSDGIIFKFSAEEADWLDHAMTENQQAIYMADIFGQVLGSLSDAFGTIINNNLNKIMKFLTGMTIILMVPTLIVGAYGMNLELPLTKNHWAFWTIMALCLLLSGSLWVFFLRKRWL